MFLDDDHFLLEVFSLWESPCPLSYRKQKHK